MTISIANPIEAKCWYGNPTLCEHIVGGVDEDGNYMFCVHEEECKEQAWIGEVVKKEVAFKRTEGE